MHAGIPSFIILRAMMELITPLANAAKGNVVVAYDPAQAIDLLHNNPGGWRVILGVDNEDSLESGSSLAGFSGTVFFAMVDAGTGLDVDASKQVYLERSGAQPSVMELNETVRSWVRGLDMRHESILGCVGFIWQSSHWISAKQDGKPLRYARQHNFILKHAIAQPVASAPVEVNWP